MEEFLNFKNLDNIEYRKQYGAGFMIDNAKYFEEKNRKLKMYDNDNVIKLSSGNIEYLNKLSNLKIDNVVTPYKIFLAPSAQIQKYYIVSKFIKNARSLEYCYKLGMNAEEMIKVLNEVMKLIEKCHQNNFYVIDLNTVNILVDKENTPYLFDFDTSCFIDNNKLYATCKYVSSYAEDSYISQIIDKYFKNDFLIEPNDYKEIFTMVDKMEIITLLLDYFFYKSGIILDQDYLLNNPYKIHKLGLSKDFEIKLLNLYCGKELSENDYFYDEINELSESKFIRKRKFK